MLTALDVEKQWVTVQMQKVFEELMGLLPRSPAAHACLACTLIVMPAGTLPLKICLL